MRLLDVFKNANRAGREAQELSRLQGRLSGLSGTIERERRTLIERCIERTVAPELKEPLSPVLRWLLAEILAFEGLYVIGSGASQACGLSTSEVWAGITEATRLLAPLENLGVRAQIEETLCQIVCNILPDELPRCDEEGSTLQAPLISLLSAPGRSVEGAMGSILGIDQASSPFPKLWQRLKWNLLTASGINPEGSTTSSKVPVPPTKAGDKSSTDLVTEYLGGTPLSEYFETPVAFTLPLSSRFEHTHIIGGNCSGPRLRFQAAQGRGRPSRVRRMASMARIDLRRAVSTTDRISA